MFTHYCYGKMFLQKFWMANVKWDESLFVGLVKEWSEIVKDVRQMVC